MPAGRTIPAFTPEQIEVLLAAFDTVCAMLRLRPGERSTEHVAVMIVDLAARGVLDFEAIIAATLGELGATRRKSGA
jgi:hypothetical protein